MNRRISLFISTLFHPVFVNLLSLLLLFILFPQLQFAISDRMKVFYILFIFTTTGLLPVLTVMLMKLIGKVSSFLLNDREDRTVPYIITASVYLFDYYFCSRIGSPVLLNAYLLACASIVVVVLIINLFNKISIHAASLGALLAVVVSAAYVAGMDIRLLLALIFVLSGLTASARLFAGAHMPHQLYTGLLLGFMVMLFLL
jgi:hypothetical protein